MAKRKKEITFSKYQEAIFNFIEHGDGNVVVEASAGAGKTLTLIHCISLIDNDKSILLTAFNKDISNELKRKTKEFANVSCSTLHGLGLKMLKNNFPDKELEIDEFKYRSYLNSNIKALSSINTFSLSKSDFFRYTDNILKYVDYGRCYLAQTVRDLDFIESRYEIETIADEKEVALDIIEWGKNDISTIDYTDMIYLPNILNCKPYGLLFDWIMVDEAQDLSIAQREIILKCRKINTRMIFVGDREQCIYSFSSSDPESFDRLKSLPNTISLPLSISYRCAKNIVSYAKRIVPTIEENNDGRIGEIVEDCQLEDINDGDMILCRNNAPLTQIYVQLIKEGKKCFIRGKDIGSNLKTIVKRTKMDELNVRLDKDGVFVRLYDGLFNQINDLMSRHNITYNEAVESSEVSSKIDMIKALEILSEGINTSDELIEKISAIFSDRKKGGISLSTIHKAKGLEAKNVYIACKSLMPNSRATKDWEIKQEYNLMYVAYTRAKDRLGFIDETIFDAFTMRTSELTKTLKAKEKLVNYLLGKSERKVDTSNPYIAKDIVRHATKIIQPKKIEKVEKMSAASSMSNSDLASFFLGRRKIMDTRKRY